MRVEAARDQHPVGSELLDGLTRHLVDRGADHVARRPGRDRQVDGEARRGGATDLIGTPGPGEQRVLVGGDVQHVGIVPEDRLRAVAVMHVPVDDEHALTQGRARCRRDGHVVHEAEPHGPVGSGMVTRRADRHERDALVPPLELRQGRQACPRGAAGCVPRIGPGVGVRVDVAAAPAAERLELSEVGRRVHARELGHRRLGDRGVHHVVFEAEGAHAVHDREQAGRLFGMVATGIVLRDAGRPCHHEGRHAAPPGGSHRVASRAASADR